MSQYPAEWENLKWLVVWGFWLSLAAVLIGGTVWGIYALIRWLFP